MTEAQTILKMIEEVSPDDTAKLDEIDARVWCFVKNRDPENDCWIAGERRIQWQAAYLYHDSKEYTRSRDALKAIRPEGWITLITEFDNGGGFILGWNCCLRNMQDKLFTSKPDAIPTEELAELHAIIQAIEFERTKP